MVNLSGENKVLGIPVEKFVKICYLLIMASAAYGTLANLVALLNVNLYARTPISLIGLVGVALAATAYVGFKEKFSEFDNSHFKFIIIFFIASFLLALFITAVVMSLGAVGSILLFLFSLLQLAIIYTGFKTLQNGQIATKETLISNFKNLKNTLKK